jgi:hypothetical protein
LGGWGSQTLREHMSYSIWCKIKKGRRSERERVRTGDIWSENCIPQMIFVTRIDCYCALFAFVFSYFAFTVLNPFTSHFSFSFTFLSVAVTFSPVFSSPCHIFSAKWHWLIKPLPGGGGGSSQYIDP